MSNDARDSFGSQPDSGSHPDWEAIARYLAGESSADESARIERWLEANPTDRALVEQLDKTAALDPATVEVEVALAKVHSQMNEPARPRLVVERGGADALRPRHRIAYKVAGLAAAAAIGFVAYRMNTRTSLPPASGYSVAAVQHYTTPVGKRHSFDLPDGSRVILGPDSKLTVAANYGDRGRSIELEGDAYFDVKHDPGKPFSVRIGRALVEDIGTTFAIESDAGDTTTVAVITGSVRLRPADSAPTGGELLSAGDRGSMAPDGKVHAYPHSVSDDTSWTTGHVVFKDASVARVIGEIHRWFGVELRVADTALLSRHVSTSFNGDEPVDQVLKVLGLTLGASVERHGDSATLSSVHGPATVR